MKSASEIKEIQMYARGIEAMVIKNSELKSIVDSFLNEKEVEKVTDLSADNAFELNITLSNEASKSKSCIDYNANAKSKSYFQN